MPQYGLTRLYEDFHNTISELCVIVTTLATRSQCLERDVHIEGCFLRAVVTWENFIEAYFLRCMCSAKTRDGVILKPKTTCSVNPNKAFERLRATNIMPEQDYANWLSYDKLKRLLNEYFHHRSRLQRICDSPEQFHALVTIRNAIAHRSKSAIDRFKRYVIDKHGYLTSTNLSMADLLITEKRSNSQLIFIDLIDYFDDLADILTK